MMRTVLLFATAVFASAAWGADTPAGNMGSMSHDSMSGGSMNHMSGGMMASSSQNCQGMMDETKPKLDAMSDSAMKTKAMQQMNMAQMAMNKGNAKSCMSHMHQAASMMH